MQGLGYPIWIKRPDKIDITKDQFYKLSYAGVGALFCGFYYVFHYDDNGDMVMYTHRIDLVERCQKNVRFKNIEWYYYSNTELYTCTIPKDSRLFNVVIRYLSHLIML